MLSARLHGRSELCCKRTPPLDGWPGPAPRDAAKAKALAAELRQQFRVEGGGGALRVEGGSNAEAADAADVVFWCIVVRELVGCVE